VKFVGKCVCYMSTLSEEQYNVILFIIGNKKNPVTIVNITGFVEVTLIISRYFRSIIFFILEKLFPLAFPVVTMR
jgi:hypothetical protein